MIADAKHQILFFVASEYQQHTLAVLKILCIMIAKEIHYMLCFVCFVVLCLNSLSLVYSVFCFLRKCCLSMFEVKLLIRFQLSCRGLVHVGA